MFSFDAKSVIQMLVDSNLDRRGSAIKSCSRSNEYHSDGVQILFRVSVNDWAGDRNSESDTRFVSMIFFGNVSVFYQVSTMDDFFLQKDKNPSNYINSSNHDSCWRSDGFHFLSKLYFEMCNGVNNSVAPRSLNSVDFASQIRINKVSVIWKYTEDQNHKEIISFTTKN